MARLGGDPRCDARFLYCFFYCCLPRQTRRPCHRYCRLATPPWRAFRACVCSAHRPATPSASTTATSILTARRCESISLGQLGEPPQGQFITVAKPFSVSAGQIGQVFSLALDDATPPNIYAAASSAYGLPIVVPDANGDGVPDRSRRGAPNAAFMPGLFGPVLADGGPGSIWKIDGRPAPSRCSPMLRSTACQIPDRRSARWRSIERHASSLPPIAAPA